MSFAQFLDLDGSGTAALEGVSSQLIGRQASARMAQTQEQEWRERNETEKYEMVVTLLLKKKKTITITQYFCRFQTSLYGALRTDYCR